MSPRDPEKRRTVRREPYEWVCKACGMKGSAATRADAELAAQIHKVVCRKAPRAK